MYVPLSLLKRHVKESNAIEGIHDRAGFWVQSHLAAASEVAHASYSRIPLHPSQIHRLLTHNTELGRFGGMYRRGRMRIGGRECPRPTFVPELMAWWQNTLHNYFFDAKDLSPSAYAHRAFTMHSLFLHIHPYDDGNGRTSRLLLNSLRLYRGLPWLVIEAAKKNAYYRKIESLEKDFFEKEFPDVY